MTQIRVQEGVLEGELKENVYGGSYYSFKGIPYAEPPVGNLRFKPPEPAKHWQGMRSAKEFGPSCYQRDLFENATPGGSEDCLYLNVYSPDITPKTPLPVMFWIHGGAFIAGNGNDNMYGPEFLVRQGVILVTINYRLGALGFLCLDTKDISGNAGMKDQVLALKWVNKNIRQFGGDPNNITIFGESAGGASVSFHLISPMSKGLFRRAIAQSGAAASSWATPAFPREQALALARQLGCYSEDDGELHDFFQKQPVEVFIDLNLPVTFAQKPHGLSFGVVSEKYFGEERFFSGDPIDSLRNSVHKGVDIMTGYTEDEGLLGISGLFLPEGLKKLYDLANNYVEYFVPKRISIEIPLIKQIDIGRKIRTHYLKNEAVSGDTLDNLINFLNMDFFVYDVLASAKLLAKKNNVFLYKFTCKSERNQLAHIIGLSEIIKDKVVVCHADDLMYLFPVTLVNKNIDMTSETFRYIENVTKLWTNFAKYGNPTPDKTLGVKWVPYKPDEQDYLDIGNKLAMKSFPEKDDIELWEGIHREYLPRFVA